jgi:hypothetical protein
LKTPPLPGLPSGRPRGCVGHVFTEDNDARIVRHLVLQGSIDGRQHGDGLTFRRRRRFEPGRGGSTSGENTKCSALAVRRLRTLQRFLRRFVYFALNLL